MKRGSVEDWCFTQLKHSKMTTAGLEPGPFDLESRALTISLRRLKGKVLWMNWIAVVCFSFVLFKLVSLVRVALSIWPDWLDSNFQGAFLPELNHDVDWRKRLRQHKTSILSVGQFLTTFITPSVKVSSRIWHPPIRTDIVYNQIVVKIIMCIAAPAVQIRTNHLIIHSLKPGSHLWDKHNTSEISTSISTIKRNMFLFSLACAYAYFTCVMLISQARTKL